MFLFLTVLQAIIAAALVGVILMQRSEGGGLGIGGDQLIIRKSDLRVRRFEERAGRVTIFCVDASGSAAAVRLAA